MKQIICSSDLDSDGLPHLWIIPYSFLSLSTPEAKWVLQLLIELSDFTTLCAIERIINSTLQIRKLRQGVETISWRSHREWETDKSQISQSNALSVEHCSFSTQTATRNETHSKHKQLKQHFIKDKSCWNSFYADDPKHCFLLSLSHCFKCRLLLLPSFLHHQSSMCSTCSHITWYSHAALLKISAPTARCMLFYMHVIVISIVIYRNPDHSLAFMVCKVYVSLSEETSLYITETLHLFSFKKLLGKFTDTLWEHGGSNNRANSSYFWDLFGLTTLRVFRKALARTPCTAHLQFQLSPRWIRCLIKPLRVVFISWQPLVSELVKHFPQCINQQIRIFFVLL